MDIWEGKTWVWHGYLEGEMVYKCANRLLCLGVELLTGGGRMEEMIMDVV